MTMNPIFGMQGRKPVKVRSPKRLWRLWVCAALLILAAGSPARAMETEDCLGCHAEAEMVGDDARIDGAVFNSTLHADLGCVGCHLDVSDAHPDDGSGGERLACSDCHAEIGDKYAASAHGEMAGCSDCHSPHSARGPEQVSGYQMNRMCAGCHEADRVAESHGSWLPQAGLHIEAVPCITCHTDSQNVVITWYLSSRPTAYGDFEVAGYEQLRQITDRGGLPTLLDRDANGRISIDELKAFNTAREYRDLHLVGMMTPEVASHDFGTLDNRWDCTFCHASGPEAMQTSYVAFPREDGSFRRMAVEQGAVLDAMYGTPNFYMMGATRNKLLNIAGAMIIAGGLIMPVGHGTLRFFTRKNRQGKDH